jgi:4-hydroxybenzoate polyprenyltransferase
MVKEPRATRVGRLVDYLGEMYPPAVNLPAAAASVLTVYFSLDALAGRAPVRVSWRAAVAVASLFLMALLMRVYDELKDVETDLRLGRAGDPRYKDRAIVTGRVRVEDLHALRWGVTAALFALNLPLGWPLPLAVFAAVFAFMWLSFKWFFWPAISRNILLAFVTHNPITLLFALYLVAVYARDFGVAAPTDSVVLLLVGLWLPVAAWETGRKVRRPEDETDYQTYSKKLGWKTAALVPALFIAGAAACLMIVARRAGLGWALPSAILLAAAVALGASLRFRLRPTAAHANLRPYAELFALVANVGLPLAIAIRCGVSWR